MELMRNNPFLYNREFIYPEDSLVISYNTVKNIPVNAYTYIFINQGILIQNLPYLTLFFCLFHIILFAITGLDMIS
jgi:spore germination protein